MNTNESKTEYLVLFRNPEWYADLSPDEVQRLMGGWMSWFDGLVADGICLGGMSLENQGRILQGDKQLITDGPYAETKESVIGYIILKVGSLDEAAEIARKNPGIPYGVVVEVRPLMGRCAASQLAENPSLALSH